MTIAQVHYCMASGCRYNHANECYTNPELDESGSCLFFKQPEKQGPFYEEGYGDGWSTPFPADKKKLILAASAEEE